MVLRWARLRGQQGTPLRGPLEYRAGSAFRSAGLHSMFLDTFWTTFVMVCSVLIGGMIFKSLQGNWIFIHYTLYFCAILAAFRFTQSLRPLRALPISTTRLALTLFLLPLANAGFYIGMMMLGWHLGWSATFSGAQWAPVVLTTGIASLSAAFSVRFGTKALVLMTILGIWSQTFCMLLWERFHFAERIFWIPGLILLASSLALLRRWVTTSQTYRFRGDPAAAI